MNERLIRLILEVENRDGHLSGHIRRADETPRSFSGRLGLMGAIDALVADDAGLDDIAIQVRAATLPSQIKER